MTLAFDSSVAIAAMLADHEAHAVADDALSRATASVAHVLTETYSVLTRLPGPLRVAPTDAARLIEARCPAMRFALDADRTAGALVQLAARGIGGGATYDALIALTAQVFELELLSLDRRAARTYGALGADVRMLPA